MNTQVKVVVRGLIAETNINIMNKINNESRYWHDIKGTTLNFLSEVLCAFYN